MVSDARARRVMGDAVRGRGRCDRAVMGRVERARAREGARGGRLATMTGTVMVRVTLLLMMMTTTTTTLAVATRGEDDLEGGALDDFDADDASAGKRMHTVFSTECTPYFDWQSLGLYDSWRRVGQRGKFTRLMACDEANPPGLDVVPDTHVHPNYATHPVSKDRYTAYNKPFSIKHWLEHVDVEADFIIVLDADMIFRAPMTVDLLGVRRGAPVSALYTYLIGTLPENHMGVKARVPNVERTQQVGGFTVMHREDMRTLAPRWLHWTEEVRNDPDSWANTGDIYNDNGKYGPPWISEMYGYVFAAAEVGIEFQVHDDFMLYPGYMPPVDERFPVVVHYGLTFNVLDYAFSKHWYHGFTVGCPDQELFQRPPDPSQLRSRGMIRRRDEIALHCAWGLYNATRGYAIERCGVKNPSDPPKTSYACRKDSQGVLTCDERRVDDTFRGEEAACKDTNEACCDWATKGECDKNPSFMLENCPLSCDQCQDVRCPSKCCPPGASREEDEAPPTIPVRDAIEERPAAEKPIENVGTETTTREEQTQKEVREETHDDDDEEEEEEDVGYSWRWPGVALVSLVLLSGVARVRTAMKRRERRRARPSFYRVKQ